MSFEELLVGRSATVYADFVLPEVRRAASVLDCGAGEGSITVGLAEATEGTVVGVDVGCDFGPALAHCAQASIGNARFAGADARHLPFADRSFDVVLCHSALEVIADPVEALAEMRRVLRPGGLVGVASVEYGGLILSGPDEDLLRRFYTVREATWAALEPEARPRIGRRLRGWLHEAGFVDVDAHARYLSHGTADEVRRFGLDRAADCDDPDFRARAVATGLVDDADLHRMRAAWTAWADSPDSFIAFAWCRATGRRP